MPRLLKDIGENETFTLEAWVKSKTPLTSKSGRPYLGLRLMDKSGDCDTRVWDNVEELSGRFDASDFVVASGRMVRHQGALQAHLSDITRLTGEIDYTQFLPASRHDPEHMYRDLLALIRQEVANPRVKAVLLAIFTDPEVERRYKRAPAARTNHHAYLGGLLEHSLGLARLALSVLPHYPKLDASVVLAGLLLHDIGKIDELSYADGFNYTTSGKLVGHLVMGIELLEQKAQTIPDFPADLLLQLKHTIAAHHGQIEYGSPVLPQTLEAIMVHFLDNMDSKLAAMTELLERESALPGEWTSFDKMYGRTMYKTAPFRATPDRAAPDRAASEQPPPPAIGTSHNHRKKPGEPLTISLADKFKSS